MLTPKPLRIFVDNLKAVLFGQYFEMALTVGIPLLAQIFFNCCSTSVIVVSTNKRSWIRPLTGLFAAYLGYQQFLACLDFSDSLLYNGTAAAVSFAQVLHLNNLLWINGVDLRDLVPEADEKGTLAAFRRLPSALSLTLNPRGIGTKWQVKYVPAWPAFYPNGKPSSRAVFLARQLFHLCWQYIALDFMYFTPSLQSPEEQAIMYGKGLEYRYFDLTLDQWIGRVSMTTVGWLFVARIMITFWHTSLSIIFVASGISRPEDWPPIFGSISDAYTLRNFWGLVRQLPSQLGY
jgi:hypothetical protein